MNKKLIFVVEDEKNIQELIEFNLEENGYNVRVFGNGESFLEECKNSQPDLVLLDIMLPGIDGIEVCRKLRQNSKLRKIPIIMLTARSEEIDKILGLEMGARDYITKPFSVRELITRIKVVFRYEDDEFEKDSDQFAFGNIKIDFSRRQIYKEKKSVELTYKEFELLKMLVQNKRKVLTRELILENIWGFEYCGETRTVDVHIRYLRQKLEEDDKNPIYLETVRGIGYRFNDIELENRI